MRSLSLILFFFIAVLASCKGATLIGLNQRVSLNHTLFVSHDTTQDTNKVISTIEKISDEESLCEAGAYNPSTNFYTFLSNYGDNDFPSVLVTLDATTGKVLYEANTSTTTTHNYFIYKLAYDAEENKLYGQVTPNNTYRQLVEVDPKTANFVRLVYQFPYIWGVQIQGYAYDPKQKVYYVYGENYDTQNYELMGVNVDTGAVIVHVVLPDYVFESYMHLMAYNYVSQRLYAVASNENADNAYEVAQINLTDGTFQFLDIFTHLNNSLINYNELVIDSANNLMYMVVTPSGSYISSLVAYDLSKNTIILNQTLPEDISLTCMAILA